MKNFDIEVFVKDLDKLFNDMQDKAIAGSENVATASWVIKQQQAEIEALKQIIDANNLNQNIGQFVKPTNEPVAWMVERTIETKGYGDTPYVTLLDATKSTYWIKNEIPEGYTVIPLYTHPVKELTREDRLKLIGTLKWAEDLLREAGHDEAVSDAQDCLMILRKAQEK